MLSFGALRIEEPTKSQKYAMIACPECGTATQARDDGSVLCASCVLATEGDWRTVLEKHIERYPKVLSFARCPQCLRVQGEHQRWESGMDHDSDMLLALLLRRVKHALLGKRALMTIEGMGRALKQGTLSVEDARLIWTEEHSRRVQLEVVVQHSPDSSTSTTAPKTQHKCKLEFVEERKRCEACLGESSTANRKMGGGGGDFAAKIQIRARRHHGGTGGDRTLRGLEAALPATSAQSTATAARRVARSHNGFDVEFPSRQDAVKFLNELRRLGRAPLKYTDETKKLITHDANTATSEWQRTTLVSVPPIDKHDVVFLESSNDFALVLHVRASIRLLDLVTKREKDVSADQYFKKPFDAIISTASLMDFTVIDHDVALKADAPDRLRRYFALFDCKPGVVYKGYDLDVIAHRVHLPPALPRVIIVVPGEKTTPKPPNNKKDKVVLEKKQQDLPPPSDDPPVDEQVRPLSRKERRQNKKMQRRATAAATMPPPPPHDDDLDDDGPTTTEPDADPITPNPFLLDDDV